MKGSMTAAKNRFEDEEFGTWATMCLIVDPMGGRRPSD